MQVQNLRNSQHFFQVWRRLGNMTTLRQNDSLVKYGDYFSCKIVRAISDRVYLTFFEVFIVIFKQFISSCLKLGMFCGHEFVISGNEAFFDPVSRSRTCMHVFRRRLRKILPPNNLI